MERLSETQIRALKTVALASPVLAGCTTTEAGGGAIALLLFLATLLVKRLGSPGSKTRLTRIVQTDLSFDTQNIQPVETFDPPVSPEVAVMFAKILKKNATNPNQAEEEMLKEILLPK